MKKNYDEQINKRNYNEKNEKKMFFFKFKIIQNFHEIRMNNFCTGKKNCKANSLMWQLSDKN